MRACSWSDLPLGAANSSGASSSPVVYHNGVIHTMDSACPRAEVLAVDGAQVAYAGNSLQDALAALPAGARCVDLEGHCVIPGIIDSHLHFLTEGQRLSEIDIFWKPKDEILRLVAAQARHLGPGKWILGRGWNHEGWRENRWPCKEELDAVAPHNPVVLTRADAHSMWVNSLALREAGIDEASPNPRGGEILRTENGSLLGILVDTPMARVLAAVPPMTDADMLRACQLAEREFFTLGITSVGDAWLPERNFALLKEAYAAGDLRIRVYGMLGGILSAKELHNGQLADSVQPVEGLFDERLSLRAFKLVCDGSIGSRSAWLGCDYADRPGHRGNGRYTDENLCALVRAAHSRGFQLCMHAIGDAAVQQALNALEMTLGEDTARYRNRIEHFQTAGRSAVAQAIRLGVVPSMQTIHEFSDRAMARIRLDEATLNCSYPWRDVLDGGGIFSNGSDCPMEIVNPFMGFYAAVSRAPYADGRPAALSREEALKSYTVWAAYSQFEEQRKGSLSQGKLADFAVLDRDILACSVEDIRQTRAVLTVLGGEPVHLQK